MVCGKCDRKTNGKNALTTLTLGEEQKWNNIPKYSKDAVLTYLSIWLALQTLHHRISLQMASMQRSSHFRWSKLRVQGHGAEK